MYLSIRHSKFYLFKPFKVLGDRNCLVRRLKASVVTPSAWFSNLGTQYVLKLTIPASHSLMNPVHGLCDGARRSHYRSELPGLSREVQVPSESYRIRLRMRDPEARAS